jgi:spore coat protein U-like protein
MKRLLIMLASLVALWLTAESANAQECRFEVEDATLSGDPRKAVSVRSGVQAVCSSGNWADVLIARPITVCPALGMYSGENETMSSGSDRLTYRFYADSSLKTFTDPTRQGFVARVSQFLIFRWDDEHSFSFYTALVPNQQAAVGQYVGTSDALFYYRWSNNDKDRDCSSFHGKAIYSTFKVAMKVEPSCELSTEPVDFGSAANLDAAINAQGKIAVSCTKNSKYKISLGGGQSNDIKNRQMFSGKNKVKYNLYLDGNRTNVWGTELNATANGLADSGGPASYDVYGQVPIQPTPATGVYTDSVIVTVDSN